MIALLRRLFGWLFIIFSSREDRFLENLALRQQSLALHNKNLTADWRPLTSSSGLPGEEFGQDGRSRSCWSH
jgi:hypothetical protein